MNHTPEELLGVVKTLSNRLWESKVTFKRIESWLGNFSTAEDQHLAIHLLAHFSYFGEREMRHLLKSLYRDLVRYPLVQDARLKNAGTFEEATIEPHVNYELQHTRFLGMGNPSESGQHLLYYFRQENEIPRGLFINAHEIFKPLPRASPAAPGAAGSRSYVIRDPDVKRYIFLDDLCGSGTQAVEYSNKIVESLIDMRKDVEVNYYCIFAFREGLDHIRNNTKYSAVRALFELDESFHSLLEESRYYLKDEQDSRRAAAVQMRKYGESISPGHPLGYKNGQLLFGFFHNVPDNTLPIFWGPKPWTAIFGRYPKIEW